MEGEVITGPWRATRLWNDVVRGFHAGMPRRSRKHKSRRGLGAALAPLRPHHGASSSEDAAEECFSGSEAAEWLHKRLIKNPNFGPDVSKEQTAMLLQKMLRAGIFVPVNSGQEESVGADGDWDKGRAEFSPSALYRFVEVGVESLRTPGKKTPSKSSNGERRAASSNGLSSLDNSYCAPAAPSATSSSASIVGRKSRVGRSELTAEDKENLNRSYFHSLPANSLLAAMDEEGERVWGEAFTALLGRDLQQSSLLPAPVQVKCVVHNMTRVSPKGVVQLDGGRGQDGEDLPHWVLSAMKCLANWPRPLRMASGEDSPLPSYPGFAQDVFGVVKDYFLETCRTPLVPFGLYEAFVSVLLKAEGMGRRVPRPQMSQHHHLAPTYGRHHPQPPPPFQSQPPPSVATSTPTLAAAASTATASNYGLDPFLLSGREQQHERVARIRHTLDVKTAGHTASTASLGNSSSFFDHSHSTTVSSGMSECQPGPHSAPSIQQQQQQPRGAVAPPRRLSPSMSTTAIIRTFLPPNTCFETAFMHEDPVTRIVPQKGSDTIHLNRSAAVGPPPEQHARMSSTSSQRNLSLIQQQQQQQQQAVRQPRWRRTSRERQSIAVMEGHLRPQQQQWNSYHYHRQQQQQQQQRPPRHPSPARSECLYSSRRQSFQPQRPSRNLSSSADDLLDSSNRSNATLLSYRPRHTSPHSAVSETYHTNPDASRGCSSSAASDHIILSKAVRKEKRKQQLKKGQQQQQRSRSADGCSLPHQTREWRPPQQQQQQQHQVRYRSDRYRSLVVKTPILVDARTGLPTEGVRCVRAEPYSNSSAEGSREDVLQDQGIAEDIFNRQRSLETLKRTFRLLLQQ